MSTGIILSKGLLRSTGFTKLVYYEITSDITSAITREKQIKGLLRRKKIALIEAGNPDWKDLAEGWFDIDRDP